MSEPYTPTGLVKLTRGFVSLVDPEDLAWISKNRWCVRLNPNMNAYACRGLWNGGKGKFIHLHREVWERRFGRKVKPNHDIHHLNGNSLDNRASNLKEITRSLHIAIRPAYKNRKHRLQKGVFRSRSRINPFRSQILINKRQVNLGLFKTEKAAKAAFDLKWKETYGDQL